jgi:hypothetical protein
MTTLRDIDELAVAMRRATEKRGRPCTLTLAELWTHGGPLPPVIEQIGTEFPLRLRLWRALGGREGWGSLPAYGDGRFAV